MFSHGRTVAEVEPENSFGELVKCGETPPVTNLH